MCRAAEKKLQLSCTLGKKMISIGLYIILALFDDMNNLLCDASIISVKKSVR